MTATNGALTGLCVVDFTQVLAGPFCTQLLADHGADVIKVEPIYGDETRRLGPFRPDDELRAYGGYFQSVNRNKRGIALDLKSEAGRNIALRLIDQADVVAENYRPGVMTRLGLDYNILAERNPRLVYAAISGFGDPRTGESPFISWPALDIVSQAMGGLIGITGQSTSAPLKSGPGIGDMFPGALSAFGILAAVLHARSTGSGQFVDVSMVDSVLALCERIVHQHSYNGAIPVPEGNQHPILCPYGLLQTQDGWIALAAHSAPFWSALCQAMGHADLIDDPRFNSNGARLANRDETYRLVETFTRRHTTAGLIEILGGKIPLGPVYSAKDIFADPHFQKRDMLAQVEQPGSATPVTIAGVPVHMTKTPGSVRNRAPLLGEHTKQILAGIGIGAAEYGALRDTGVVI